MARCENPLEITNGASVLETAQSGFSIQPRRGHFLTPNSAQLARKFFCCSVNHRRIRQSARQPMPDCFARNPVKTKARPDFIPSTFRRFSTWIVQSAGLGADLFPCAPRKHSQPELFNFRLRTRRPNPRIEIRLYTCARVLRSESVHPIQQ